MKKIVPILVLCIVLLTACNMPGTTQNGSKSKPPAVIISNEAKASDYFPLNMNVHMKYRGLGNEYAQYETYVDYVRDGLIQLRTNNGGTVVATVYRLKDGILKKVFMRAETYYRYDYTSMSNHDEIIIKEPIKAGTSWSLSDSSLRSITAVDKQITTPSGDYKALEITTKNEQSTIRDYYVKNIGLVKTEFRPVGGDTSSSITSELEKIENDVPYSHPVRFYFPEFLKDRLVYIERNIEIKTNENMKFKFQRELKTIPENSGLSKVLTKNTQVLGCSLDEKNGIATVNLSSDFIKEMNAGTSFESMLLKSITNTIGYYYQMNKVIILIDGKPYESGHILMKKGEYFTVDIDNISVY